MASVRSVSVWQRSTTWSQLLRTAAEPILCFRPPYGSVGAPELGLDPSPLIPGPEPAIPEPAIPEPAEPPTDPLWLFGGFRNEPNEPLRPVGLEPRRTLPLSPGPPPKEKLGVAVSGAPRESYTPAPSPTDTPPPYCDPDCIAEAGE